jgi:hypothetical protein
MIDHVSDIAESANFISEAFVLFEVRLAKFRNDDIPLEYFRGCAASKRCAVNQNKHGLGHSGDNK